MGSTPIGISASRGSGILGVNKYKSPLVSFLEIMEQLKPGFCAHHGYQAPEKVDPWAEPLNPKHASLRWGLGFEDAITDIVGGITERERLYENHDNSFPMTCHIDGLKNGRVQENKTAFEMAFKMGWGEPLSDMVPESYQVQIQHQLYLTGLEYGDFNVLVFPKPPAEWEKMGYRVDMNMGMMMKNGNGVDFLGAFAQKLATLGYFHQYHVQSNPATQKEMIDRYRAFWNDCVLKETHPPVNGYDDIKWLISSPEGEIEANEIMRDAWEEYDGIHAAIDDMLTRADECKDIVAREVQKEIQALNLKPGVEKRKLNIMAGSRKIASITKAWPGLRVSSSMVDSLKEGNPDLYGTAKKTSFADIMPEEIELTDGQKKKVEDGDMKILNQLKLTKLLSKDSIMKHLKKNQPDLFKFFYERGIVEETEPKASFRMFKTKQED